MPISIQQIPHNLISGAIRRVFSRSETCKAARSRAKHPETKGPRGGNRYICQECGNLFGARDTQIDHNVPVIPLGSSLKDMSWDRYIERLFCDVSNLDCLCKGCHKQKTQAENKIRREMKKKVKEGMCLREAEAIGNDMMREL